MSLSPSKSFPYPLYFSVRIRKALCEYQRDNPDSSQKKLKEWLLEEHRVNISKAVISDVLKCSSEYLQLPATETVGEDENESDESLRMLSESEEDPGSPLQGYDSDGFDSERMEDGSDTEFNEEVYEEMEDESDNQSEEEEEMEEDESDNQAEEEEEMEEDGPLTISNPDILDCPICMEPLSIPVYLCENGHVACSPCCLKLTDHKCPSCSSKIGQNRCFIVEKMLESVTAPCKNKKYGCEEMLKYCNKNAHEKICLFTPCSCPVKECNFEGTMAGLYAHFSCSHLFPTQVFFFNEYNPITLEKNQRHLIFCGEDNSILVLTRFSQVKSCAIKVVQIASLDSARFHSKCKFGYVWSPSTIFFYENAMMM